MLLTDQAPPDIGTAQAPGGVERRRPGRRTEFRSALVYLLRGSPPPDVPLHDTPGMNAGSPVKGILAAAVLSVPLWTLLFLLVRAMFN